jgi:hypothetical protein
MGPELRPDSATTTTRMELASHGRTLLRTSYECDPEGRVGVFNETGAARLALTGKCSGGVDPRTAGAFDGAAIDSRLP